MKKRWLFISNAIFLLLFITLALKPLFQHNESIDHHSESYSKTYELFYEFDEDENCYFDNDEFIHQILHGRLFEIFFGEYTVLEQVAVRKRAHGSDEIIPDISGIMIHMNSNRVSVDGITVSERPLYNVMVSEMNHWMHNGFIPGSPLIDMSFDLFVSVEVGENPFIVLVDLDTSIRGDFQFYIKDSNTIYLVYNNALYRTERNNTEQ